MPRLEIDISAKTYRRPDGTAVEAVRGLRVVLAPGEFVCLIGPSGCGKTTTLRILLGLDRAYEGRVVPDPATLRIGMVFQEPRLLPWRSVEENIRLCMPRQHRARPLDELFAAFGLAEWRGRYPGELSLGLARRVSLVRAIVNGPDLLVLDEPFVSLDDRAAAELRQAVMAAVARHRMTVVMVTHNLREAIELADRLVFLAPRPTRVIEEVALAAARPERGPAWIEAQRAMLAARGATA
ncbi:ABC transporter ATP-binding protein [Labrys wisconsinensis]|uniref:NitT/TauT family transport system ATP-binding protein n=1 Tax=Labrys wisconsinensis TaxID=425677 RepID=A0ABU0IYP6_9HYPH|nr:ATP-binding cassette domain-containing protein [Labrys wisconsinensis]MDQ0467140.1 NitT/TauT family transport system ATP-binding protein [Labrys wisconsinensis]